VGERKGVRWCVYLQISMHTCTNTHVLCMSGSESRVRLGSEGGAQGVTKHIFQVCMHVRIDEFYDPDAGHRVAVGKILRRKIHHV
jgi:hypothetical protein